MSGEGAGRRERVRTLFDLLVDLDPAEAAARLEREEADPDVRADVLSLLAADHTPADALNLTPDDLASIFADDADDGAARLVGAVVGPYRLVEVLGVGGMGAVFRAIREDLGLTVAVKLIRGAMGDPGRIARFRREQQVLAQLDHPNIARLLDAGVAADGTQYLVMGYVAGDQITPWCGRQGLGIVDRLKLFLALCEAVAYAHQNLVVHRDLKPSNVLVTPQGTVMLLDFGVAKLIEEGAVDPELTGTGIRIFSPEYASPEQLSGGPITTATDVHGLGLLLYELLTGERPFPAPARGKPFHPTARPLPPRPSTRGTGRASLGGSGRRRVDADLDAICLKALAAEPAGRYSSVPALASDVSAYLEGRPVEARLPTRRYRAAKLLSRHRAVTAIIGLALALVVFAAADVARGARQARQDLAEAQDLSAFVLGVFRSTGPSETRGTDVPVESFLKLAGINIDDLTDRPMLRARTLEILALGYLSIGDYAAAVSHAREAIEGWRSLGPGRRAEVASGLRTLGTALFHGADPAGAADVLRPALALQRQELGEHHRETTATMILLAEVIRDQGGHMEAERLAREALAIRLARRMHGRGPASHGEIVEAMTVLATILQHRGPDYYLEAERLLRDGLTIREGLYGPDDFRVDPSVAALGAFLTATGRGPEGEAMARRSLALRRAVYGDEHPRTVAQLNALAEAVLNQGRTAEARALFERVVARYEAAFDGDHLMLAVAIGAVGRTHAAEARYGAAESHLQRALAMRIRLEGAESPGVAGLHHRLGDLQARLGKAAEAEASLRAAAAQHARFWGESGTLTLRSRALLGSVIGDLGRLDEAEDLLRDAIRGQAAVIGDEPHGDLAVSWSLLGRVLMARGGWDEAHDAHRRALFIARTGFRTDSQVRADVVAALREFYAATGRTADAERLIAEEAGVAGEVIAPAG